MRIFVSKWFRRFARKEGIGDADLIKAAHEVARGLVDADLGGRVFKKRMARKGSGKRGGYRTILFFKKGHRLFFAYGFPKNARGNIDEAEEEQFRVMAGILLKMSDEELAHLIAEGAFFEIKQESQDG